MEIYTIAEHRDGELDPVSFELMNLANSIKGDGKSNAIVLSPQAGVLAGQLEKHADKVWAVSDEAFENYNPEIYIDVIFQLMQRIEKPGLVLVGNTPFGIEFAPYLAAKLNAPVQTDVVNVDLSDGVSISKYLCQGKVMVDISLSESDYYVLTIRQKVFKEGPEVGGESELIDIKPSIEARRKFVRYIAPEVGEVDISREDVLVTVGRGIKDESKIEIAEELAELLGGVVAGSRPVIDYGWLPRDRQVGVSGKVVSPKLYLSLGVSGASQHVMGMSDSGCIIAVNKDPEAPIFEVAEYGIIGDIFEIVPEVLNRIKQIKR